MATSGSGEPDMVLVSELLEQIERHPPAIAARKVLVEHYIAVSWLDAAKDGIVELKKHDPRDADVLRLAQVVEKEPEPPARQTTRTRRFSNSPKPIPNTHKKPYQPPPKTDSDLDAARKDLTRGYSSLRTRAGNILANIKHLSNLQKKNGVPQSQNTARIQAIVDGRKATASRTGPPGGVRGVARTIQANKLEKATALVIADLEDAMKWMREPHGKTSAVDDDTVREALVKRMQALEAALPDNLKIHAELGLMHVVHENLEKAYANDETMLGDLIKDIPREDFYVTEDNYAWAMTELVQAITVNGGVMRNPLSRQMFTPKDIRGILVHPEGKSLVALQVKQDEMSKGVRPDTITEMEKLSRVLLDDDSRDQLPSRHAIDVFMAYIATLPELEQKAIDGLRCPAKDSHTGQNYDFSIGEAVRDAKANRVCSHKTGDFIKQAATFLRQNRGAAADADKCIVM
ncbi:hypothetical protein CC80DRAFT_237981 [Byssothecium circinans]|uniref:Uncharacterized protein n=1 Tax=Byssothecium circinans TaxID=147558 RepID=A0A6A5U970_9PLEO|nr:hypothetical protein CC80DRAFT_237981 [Byssothecium circinans]